MSKTAEFVNSIGDGEVQVLSFSQSASEEKGLDELCKSSRPVV